MSKTHEIVILGAHHGGINTAHYLLRHTIPQLSKVTPSVTYHLTIVAPNTDFYWNVAAPRHLVTENQIESKDVWLSIADAFKGYDKNSFTFIKGKASAVNPDAKVVTVSADGKARDLTYSTLVIATGSSYTSQMWQVNESDDATKAELSAVRASLKDAKSILISGGGAVGVETAGEVGSFYKKEITLLSGTTRLLPRLTPGNSTGAEWKLKELGVKTLHNLRVKSSTKNADGTTTLKFSDGSSRPVDVYIDATGPKPNTSFLPASWIDSNGRVIVNNLTLRAPVAGVYAVGDVATHCDGGILSTGAGIPPLCTSIGIDIAKAAGKESPFKQKTYSGMEGTQLVPTGPSGGVGQLFGWWLPSFLVWLAKSRTFFLSMAKGAVEGGNVTKA
jgi:NADH dehydrogenase FAD-containing subunit